MDAEVLEAQQTEETHKAQQGLKTLRKRIEKAREGQAPMRPVQLPHSVSTILEYIKEQHEAYEEEFKCWEHDRKLELARMKRDARRRSLNLAPEKASTSAAPGNAEEHHDGSSETNTTGTATSSPNIQRRQREKRMKDIRNKVI